MCEEFKARLAKAEKALGIPVPVPVYKDEGVLGESHDWAITVKGINGELSCHLDGRFSSLQLAVDGSDKYIDARWNNLSVAVLWAYTQWPQAKVNRTLAVMLSAAKHDLKSNRIRGEPNPQGTGSIDLEPNVTASVYGGEALRLGLMIDASTGK